MRRRVGEMDGRWEREREKGKRDRRADVSLPRSFASQTSRVSLSAKAKERRKVERWGEEQSRRE